MGLFEDAEKIIETLLGPDFSKVLKTFGDPEKYPEDFLENLKYFLEKLVGTETTEEHLKTLYQKYVKQK